MSREPSFHCFLLQELCLIFLPFVITYIGQVADFAVDLENKRVYIIELNPFGDYEGL